MDMIEIANSALITETYFSCDIKTIWSMNDIHRVQSYVEIYKHFSVAVAYMRRN